MTETPERSLPPESLPSFWCRRLGNLIWNTITGFWNDDCYGKAAMLTFYTIQSIIPLLAAIIGFGKGFGLDEFIKGWITSLFSEQTTILQYLLQMADALLLNVKSGVIAGLGIIFLLWTGLNLATSIEVIFSDIWHVKIPHGFFRRFKDFLAAIILCPIIFGVSSSISVYLQTQLSSLSGSGWNHSVGVFGLFLLKFSPFVLTCLLFFFLYYFIPKVRICIWPRVVGAVFAGFMFQLWQWIYIHFQLQIWNYSTVYGALAIIPLFLVWLQFSWLIALLGAEVAAALENESFYQWKRGLICTKISHRELALAIVYKCLDQWRRSKPPLQFLEIANLAQIPIDELAQLVGKLENAGVIAKAQVGNAFIGYLPGHYPASVTVKEIIDIVASDPPTLTAVISQEVIAARQAIQGVEKSAGEAATNITLEQLMEIYTS